MAAGADLPTIDQALDRFQEERSRARRHHAATIGREVDPERCLADWLCCVAAAGRPGAPDSIAARDRLERHYASEQKSLATTAGTVGGYLVPAELRHELMQDVAELAIVRPRALVVPMATTETQFPLPDAVSVQAAGTPPFFGGMKMTWTPESLAIDENDPAFRQVSLKAWTLAGVVLASNNLMADGGVGLEAGLRWLIARSIAWHEDHAFLVGDGVGKPLGMLRGGGVRQVTRAGGGAVALADLAGMEAALLPASAARAVWIGSPGAVGQVTRSANWMTNGPMAVHGRPLFTSEKLPALGTLGDLALVDPTLYVIGDRQELLIEASPHPRFTTNQLTWRVVERVDGRPWLERTVTLQDGTTIASPYVVLN